MDITFIIPKIYQAKYLESQISIPNLGIPYLSAAIKKNGHKAKLINGEMLSTKVFINRIKSIDTRVIGISSMLFNINELFDLVNFLREYYPSKIIIAGGCGPSSLPPDYIFRKCLLDLLFLGEAEGSLCAFMDMLESGSVDLERIPGLCYRKTGKTIKVNNFDMSIGNDLDKMPFPDRDLMGEKQYLKCQEKHIETNLGPPMIRIQTSRGCPFNCSFCDKGISGQKVRLRSADNLIEEIVFSKNKYKCDSFFFNDDLFVASQQRLEEFCIKLAEKNIKISWKAHARVNSLPDKTYPLIKKAGCTNLFFGIESGSEKILKILNKKISPEEIRHGIKTCHANGIKPGGYFMVGVPGETMDDHKATISLIKELPFFAIDVAIFSPYPNSALFARLAKECSYFSWDAYTTWKDDIFSESKEKFLNYSFEISPRLIRNKMLKIADTYHPHIPY
jgi:radical SAM superfamily enzyme YgiQ (UPF0313 family)